MALMDMAGFKHLYLSVSEVFCKVLRYSLASEQFADLRRGREYPVLLSLV
jgi:hypothetical protein